MKIIPKKRKTPRGLIMAAVLAFTLVSGVTLGARAQADTLRPVSGEHLVTVHDNGSERSFLTKAETLRTALESAKIRVDEDDLVEPALDNELVASNYEVNIYRARPVTVVDGQARVKVMSPYRTPQQIAKHAGMQMHDEDNAIMASATDIVADGSGVQLTIDRATEFTLKLYGKKVTAYTQAATVGEMLKEKNITVAAADTLSASESTPMTEGMVVEIWRNGKQTITEDEKIPFTTRQINDADRPVGYKEVKTPGVNGKKTVTYEIVMKNGKEVSRKKIQSVTLEKAKEQVEIVGSKPDFDGDFAAALLKLRTCESGNNYANKNNPLYRGAYQYSYDTWGNRYGIHDPADATPAQQDAAARETYLRRGWQPWPNCGANLPDTYR